VGQVVAHAGDLAPRDAGLGIEQFGGQGLHSLADFQQPDPDRVEDQAVGQVTALQVGADRVDRGLDIGQPRRYRRQIAIVVSSRGGVAASRKPPGQGSDSHDVKSPNIVQRC
jgi:hypothetical protein